LPTLFTIGEGGIGPRSFSWGFAIWLLDLSYWSFASFFMLGAISARMVFGKS
jgi:hypothetical protein